MKHKNTIITSCLALALAGFAHADSTWSTITWTGDSSLSFITSTNVTHSGEFGSAATINGFTFETIPIAAGFGTLAVPYSGSNFTIGSSASPTTYTGSAGVSGTASSALSSGLIVGPANFSVTYNLTGLSTNTNYEFYFFSPDYGYGESRTGVLDGSDDSGNTFAINQTGGTGDKIIKYAYNTGASTSFTMTVTSTADLHQYAFVNVASPDGIWNTTIASDTFTGRPDQSLAGTELETSLSGGVWVNRGPVAFSATTTTGFGDPLPGSLGSGGQNVIGVSIASAGAYVKPTLITISADLVTSPSGFTGTVGSASGGRGIALGFYSNLSTPANYSQNLFTGLVLDAAGNLNLVNDPNATGFFGGGSFLGTPIPYVGTWDSSAMHRLSYTVNTATGAISDISLEGSTATYTFTTSLFTDEATALAGVYISSQSSETYAGMDNFLVSSAPSADPFADWMSTNYPAIVFPDNQPGADPENDGIKNLIEYVLQGGNPSVSTTGTLPMLDATGANFVFTYYRRAAATGTTQTFEYGTTLSGWTPVAIPGGSGVVVTPDDPLAGIEKVVITVAKGVNTNLFGRLQVTK